MVSLTVTDLLHTNAMATHAGSTDVENVSAAPDSAWKTPSHPPLVYFLVNGDRVKIGTSTNITARVSALSLRRSNAELLLNGGHDLENSLHQHFASDRIGKTEWFTLSPRIRDYIARRTAADIALRQPYLPDDRTPESPTRHVITIRPTPKASSAVEKILQVLQDQTTPRGATYVHKDVIGQLADLEGSTLDNSLSRLIKTRDIHRQTKDGKEVRGMYGPGPTPALETAPDDDQ